MPLKMLRRVWMLSLLGLGGCVVPAEDGDVGVSDTQAASSAQEGHAHSLCHDTLFPVGTQRPMLMNGQAVEYGWVGGVLRVKKVNGQDVEYDWVGGVPRATNINGEVVEYAFLGGSERRVSRLNGHDVEYAFLGGSELRLWRVNGHVVEYSFFGGDVPLVSNINGVEVEYSFEPVTESVREALCLAAFAGARP